LLDSAASGWNTVEREGISIKHPARFVLVGSGNPEEGELRPQLLDRFGMHAEIRTVRDPELRVQVVEQRSNFDQNPELCLKENAEKQQALKDKIIAAQTLIPSIKIAYDLRVKISQVCSELNVDGLRGDIVTNRAAKSYAAYNGRTEVTVKDIEAVITLCLRHRLRKDPLESIDSGDKVKTVFEEIFK
jgi:magnesium chelatase subunit I